ncbi:hypothetical protein HDV01_002957 [Terramyces sp. JEL0728]|nr:hypothetical protein HDV01_002957 [Terramyces sp. JEL0728]
MKLVNLPFELQSQIINNLDIKDLGFLSLVNKSYYALLAPYRIFGPQDCPIPISGKSIELKLTEDEVYYCPGDEEDIVGDDRVMKFLNPLENLHGGIYKFHHVDIGGFFYSSLLNSFPPSDELHLMINVNSRPEILIDWNSNYRHQLTELQLGGLFDKGYIIDRSICNLVGLKNLSVYMNLENNKENWDTIGELLEKTALEILEIGRNRFMNNNIRIFTERIPYTSIKALHIMNCDLDDSSAKDIANILPNCLIKQLNLSRNAIRDAGTEALANIVSKCNLEQLDLSYNKVTSVGLLAISKSLGSSNIKDLIIENNDFAEEDISILLEHLPNSQIDKLELRDLDSNSEEILVSNISKSNVQHLCIEISLSNLKDLLIELQKSKIRKLEIQATLQPVKYVEIVAKYLKYTNLDELNISAYEAREEFGICNFIQGLLHSKLSKLILISMGLHEEEARLMSQILPQTNLSHLCLCFSNMEDKDLELLVPGIQKSRLKTLEILGNHQFTSNGVIKVISVLKDTVSRHFTLSFSKEFKPDITKLDRREIRRILGDFSNLTVQFV